MSDFLLNAHAIWQYMVISGVVISLVFSFQSVMTATAERIYRLTAVAADIQVALGIALWIASSGWDLGFMQGWLHPIVGIAVVAVLHAFMGRGREAGPEDGNKVVRVGLIIAVVLVATAVGIAQMA